MSPEAILLLHGFASSANSTKAHFFRENFRSKPLVQFDAIDFNPTPRDFEYMTVTGMVNRLRQYLLDRALATVSLIGSSMGALVGLHYAQRFGGVTRMLLLAPALSFGELSGEPEQSRWQKQGHIMVHHYAFEREVPLRHGFHLDGQQYSAPIAPPSPIMIVHGRFDEVVSIELSRAYTDDYPGIVTLLETDSDHRLNDQLHFIWDKARSFLMTSDQ